MKPVLVAGLKIAIVLVFNLSCQTIAQAQKLLKESWSSGEVVTTTGDTIRGQITFYREMETVRVVGPDNQDRAFLPSQVKYFTGRDKSSSHSFISVLWERNRDNAPYKVPAFFELLAEGDMCLLKRTMQTSYSEKQGGEVFRDQAYGITRQIALGSIPGAGFSSNFNNDPPVDHYYLLDLSDKLIPLPQPKEDLLLQLSDKYPELEAYIRKNKLSLKENRGMIKVVKYYNQLKESKR